MNRFNKILVGLMLVIIGVYVIVSIALPNIVDDVVDIVDGDSENTVKDENEISYTIDKINENEIGLTSIDDNFKLTTKFVFENDEISSIVVIQEVNSGDLVSGIYEAMQNDEKLKQTYKEIKLEENVIVMTLKDEYVAIYDGVKYDELYQKLVESLNISNAEVLETEGAQVSE